MKFSGVLSGKKRVRGRISRPGRVMSALLCSRDEQAGRTERYPHRPVLKSRGGKGGALGPGAWGEGAVAPGSTCWVARAFSSPLAQTVD